MAQHDETIPPRYKDPVESAVRHWGERYGEPGSTGFRALTSLVYRFFVAANGRVA